MPVAMDTFLGHWKPNAIVLMESELWPNLIMGASEMGIILVLLNARVSTKSFKRWSGPVLLPLISLMLSKFSLIAPLVPGLDSVMTILIETLEEVVEGLDMCEGKIRGIEDLKVHLSHRQVWVASSIHGAKIKKLLREGHGVTLRSQHDKLVEEANILVVDTFGELRHLYRLTPVAVIGGSFLPGLSGHNISEAAAANCAILTGPHVGHFSCMIRKMERLNPLSVKQVAGELELEEALRKLFSDVKILEEHRAASQQVYHALPSGIIGNVLDLLDFHIFQRYLSFESIEDQHVKVVKN